MKRLNLIIEEYKRYYGPEADRVNKFAKAQKTLVNAIEVATLSEDDAGVRDSHQNRIPKGVLKLWSNSVIKETRLIRRAASFEQILDILKKARVKGIGELAIYDTAARIGTFRKIYPDKIYLHAGTKIGVQNLLGKIKSKHIFKNQLPQEFQREDLSCSELENLLCIFKDVLDPSLDEKTFRSRLSKIISKC
jgi:hypothetical protein